MKAETINAWCVIKGHNGNLVVVRNPSPDAEIVRCGFLMKSTALKFIEDREREQRIGRRVFVAFAVIALGGVAWGVWA